jgi:prepilin-type N-terminal cleavage/methylation domain-containing protein
MKKSAATTSRRTGFRRPCAARGRRRGYTLVEMIVTLSAGSIVLAGLSSTLYISSRTLSADTTASSDGSRSSLALSQITSDLRLALDFTERSSTAATFTVPDRTGDGAIDTIRYSWAGTDSPLLYQFNGGTAVTLVPTVKQFSMVGLTRTIAATTCALPATIVAYAAPPEGKAATAATSVTVNAPVGLAPGHFMLAACVVDADATTTLAAPAGWTLVGRIKDSTNTVTTGVWWKFATASEAASYQFTWTGSRKAYAWITRFTGVEPSAPINVSGTTTGGSASATPSSPSVTTTVANAMIVRIGGFDDGDVNVDNAGVTGHTSLTADESDAGASATNPVSGAAAYVLRASAGSTGTANFTLAASEEFVTFTIALRPDDGL